MKFSDPKVGFARQHEFKGVLGIGSIRVHLNRLSRLLSRKTRAFRRVVPVHLNGKIYRPQRMPTHVRLPILFTYLKKNYDRV